MPNYSIEQILDITTLQEMQDAYSEFTGLAAIITDSAGRQVTNPSGFSDICINHIRTSTELVRKCMEHTVTGSYESIKIDGAYIYKCHAGLICFTAPIMLEDIMIGCFSSGQVVCSDEDERQLFVRFSEMGFGTDKCVRLTEGIVRITPQELRKAASFLYKLSQIISKLAYKNYLMMRKNEMQENAPYASINGFIADAKNPAFERLYNTREFFSAIADSAGRICKEYGMDFKLDIDDSLPIMLLGNPALLKAAIVASIMRIASMTTSKEIHLETSYKESNYSCSLVIDVIAYDDYLSDEMLYSINTGIYEGNSPDPVNESASRSYLTDIVIKKLSGTVKVMIIDGKGTSTHMTLPQLTDKENQNGK